MRQMSDGERSGSSVQFLLRRKDDQVSDVCCWGPHGRANLTSRHEADVDPHVVGQKTFSILLLSMRRWSAVISGSGIARVRRDLGVFGSWA